MCLLLFVFCEVAYSYKTHCGIIKLLISTFPSNSYSWRLAQPKVPFLTSWSEFDQNGIDSGTLEHTSLLSSAPSLSLLSTSGCKNTSVLFGRGVMTSWLCCRCYDRPFCPPATISVFLWCHKKSVPLVLRMKVWKKKEKVAGGGVCVCVHVCVWEGVVCVEIQERS